MNIHSIRQWFGRASELMNEFYNAPYRSAIARAKRDEDDLFMLLVMMGVPIGRLLHAQLQPLMLERFHEWHQRMGMEHSRLITSAAANAVSKLTDISNDTTS